MTDVRLCPDCEEIVEGHTYHPSCCPHEAVETVDEADGVLGAGSERYLVSWCLLCGSQVLPEVGEDGHIEWTLP